MTVVDHSIWVSNRITVLNTWTAPYPILKSYLRKLTRTRTGTSLPKWRQLIESKVSATTALTGDWERIEFDGQGGIKFTYGWGPSGWDATAPHYVEQVSGETVAYKLWRPRMSFTWSSRADGRAKNRFLSAVRKTQTEVSGLTFLGEIRQTLAMVRRPGEALWRSCNEYYRALRKRKRADPFNWAKAVPGLWLEYSFGWKPLIMDINDGMDAYQACLRNGDYLKTVSASGVDDMVVDSGRWRTNYDAYCSYLWFDSNYREVEKEFVRYKGGVRVQAATTFKDVAARWGFTPSDFVPTLWELLPWSFLVDYFATIGDMLDATYADQRSLVWVNKTVRKTGTINIQLWGDEAHIRETVPAKGIVSIASESPAVGMYERKSVSRSNATGLVLSPEVIFQLDRLNWGRIGNISALLGQFGTNLHTQNPSRRTWRK